MAAFIKDLGKGKCWNEYAEKVAEIDIDGSTLMDADLEILVELGEFLLTSKFKLKMKRTFWKVFIKFTLTKYCGHWRSACSNEH